MADLTSQTAVNQFQQLRNRQNDLYRKNTAALIAAAKAADMDSVNLLRAERATLLEADKAILDSELRFAECTLDQSEAEKRLIAQVQSANAMVRRIETLSDVLDSAAQMAIVVKRLIVLLT